MTWYVVYKIWKILKIKSACMDVSGRSYLHLCEFKTRYPSTDRWSPLLKDMVKMILAGYSQSHMRLISMKSSLEAPIWLVFSKMLVRVKTFFLADLDLFFKSLKFFQRLKMNFWRRWRGKRKMKKKIIFL